MIKLFNILNKSKRFKYHLVSPLHFAIGTAAEQISVALKFANLQKKSLIILKPYKFMNFKFKVCNNYLFEKLISKYIKKNTDLVSLFFNFIFNIYLFSLIIKHFFSESKNYYPDLGLSLQLLHKNDENQKFDFTEQIIFLPKKDQENFLTQLSNHTNYNLDQKIITIHFRDSIYRNDASRWTYRNSSIKNFYKSINYLLEKGYFVVRVGNIAKEKFKIDHDNFFDYPFSKIVSDRNDLFFIKNSSFYIGTNSGLTEIAYLFNIPVLLHNMNLMFEGYPRKKCDRGILKNIYFGDNKKKLRLREFIDLPNDYHHSLMHNTKLINEFIFEENSEDQIFKAVKEYEYLYSKNNLNQHTLEQEELNKIMIKKLNEIYKHNIEKIHKKKIVEKKDLDEPYKNLRYKNFLNGAISNIYLLNQDHG